LGQCQWRLVAFEFWLPTIASEANVCAFLAHIRSQRECEKPNQNAQSGTPKPRKKTVLPQFFFRVIFGFWKAWFQWSAVRRPLIRTVNAFGAHGEGTRNARPKTQFEFDVLQNPFLFAKKFARD
jgi:hypothetical protein